MMNKYLRLIIFEPRILLKALTIVACLFVIIIEVNMIRLQARAYAKAKKEKELIARIPEMQKKINLYAPVAGPIIKVIYTLQGTSIKDDVPYALIDNQIFKKGDRVGEFELIEIARGLVVLQNPVNKEMMTLRLPSPDTR